MIIDKQQLIDRLGKQKAVEFMTQNRSNQPTGHDKTKGIRGRVRWSMCEHGNWVISDYKPTPCLKCVKRGPAKSREFKPYFNMGLGAYVESRQDEKKLAKKMGLIENG